MFPQADDIIDQVLPGIDSLPSSQTPATGGESHRYRPDVDGLRAVAVLFVVLYHLNPALAPSGFVGVDLFFVISGFVVTSSVIARLDESPLKSMARFWRRRILRIIPAMVVMVFISSILLALVRVPFPILNYQAEVRTGIAGLAGLANQYLYRGSADYFAASDTVNPFIHMWSLGVEEQFYLIFACVFLGALGMVRSRQRRTRISVALMSALGILSYGAFLAEGASHTALVYYLIPFRFWEIAVGSLLAFGGGTIATFINSRRLNTSNSLFPASEMVSLGGMGILCWSVWGQSITGFPSLQISESVIAAALLIAGGTPLPANNNRNPGGAWLTRILSSRIAVSLGLASYSLYLWHFPILQLWRTEVGLNRPIAYLAVLTLIAVLALLSYFFIERPIRKSRTSFAGVLLPLIATSLIVTAGLCVWIQSHPGKLYIGSPQRWDTEWDVPQDHAFLPDNRLSTAACLFNQDHPLPSAVPAQCASAPAVPGTDKLPTLLALGDSHAWADWPMDSFGARAGAWNLSSIIHVGCVPDGWEDVLLPTCKQYWNLAPLLMRQNLHRGDTLFIAILWPLENPQRSNHAVLSIAKLARQANQLGADVIVEAPQPTFRRPAYLCTSEWYRWDLDGCTTDRTLVEARRASVMRQLADLTRSGVNVRIWDPLPLLCPDPVCSQFQGSLPVFRDSDHLAVREAAALGPPFLEFWKDRNR